MEIWIGHDHDGNCTLYLGEPKKTRFGWFSPGKTAHSLGDVTLWKNHITQLPPIGEKRKVGEI